MELVEVDIVDAEPPERAFDGVEDVLAGAASVPGPGARGPEALRGDDELVPPSLEPPAEDVLGASHGVEPTAQRVDVGRVEEGDPACRGAVEDGDRCGLIALQPEGHRAEAEARDGQAGAAETGVAHRGSQLARPRRRVQSAVCVTAGRGHRRAGSEGMGF